MPLRRFIHELVHTGRIRFGATRDGDVATATTQIADLDLRLRAHAPASAPELELEVALWAAHTLHSCCRLAKDLDPPEPVDAIAPKQSTTAAAIWSADLFLQHLPGVHKLTRHLATAHAVHPFLADLGHAWPLSSIGQPGVTIDATHLATIEQHPCLRQLYIDRVLERSDASRHDVAWVQSGLERATFQPTDHD